MPNYMYKIFKTTMVTCSRAEVIVKHVAIQLLLT